MPVKNQQQQQKYYNYYQEYEEDKDIEKQQQGNPETNIKMRSKETLLMTELTSISISNSNLINNNNSNTIIPTPTNINTMDDNDENTVSNTNCNNNSHDLTNSGSGDESELLKCQDCNMEMQMSDYFTHGKEIHEIFSCLYCRAEFKFSKELMIHLNHEHSIPTQKFNNGQDFLDRGGNDTTLLCVECNKVFQSEGLVTFMKYHSQECRKSTGICPKCGSVCKLSLLGPHIVECRGKMNVNLLGSTTITTSQLRNRDNSCRYCGRKFSPSKIAAHIRACSARSSKMDYGHPWNYNNTYSNNNQTNPVIKPELDDIQIDIVHDDSNKKLKTIPSKQTLQHRYGGEEPSISVSKVKDGTVVKTVGGSEILKEFQTRKASTSSRTSNTSSSGRGGGRMQQRKDSLNTLQKPISPTRKSTNHSNSSKSSSLLVKSENDVDNDSITNSSSSINFNNSYNSAVAADRSSPSKKSGSFSPTSISHSKINNNKNEYLNDLSPASFQSSSQSTDYNISMNINANTYDSSYCADEEDNYNNSHFHIADNDPNLIFNSSPPVKERKRKKEKKEIKLDPLLLEPNDDKRLDILISELSDKLSEKQMEMENTIIQTQQQQTQLISNQIDNNNPVDEIIPPITTTSIPTATTTAAESTTTELLSSSLEGSTITTPSLPSSESIDQGQVKISSETTTTTASSETTHLPQVPPSPPIPPRYELIVNYSLDSRTDEDILNDMILKSSVDCAYCRLVRLIRIDKRQLVIHLLSKHSWEIRVLRTPAMVLDSIIESRKQSDDEIKSNLNISIKLEAGKEGEENIEQEQKQNDLSKDLETSGKDNNENEKEKDEDASNISQDSAEKSSDKLNSEHFKTNGSTAEAEVDKSKSSETVVASDIQSENNSKNQDDDKVVGERKEEKSKEVCNLSDEKMDTDDSKIDNNLSSSSTVKPETPDSKVSQDETSCQQQQDTENNISDVKVNGNDTKGSQDHGDDNITMPNNNNNAVTAVSEELDSNLKDNSASLVIKSEIDEEDKNEEDKENLEKQHNELLSLAMDVDENLKWIDFKLSLLQKIFHAPNVVYTFTGENLGNFGDIPCECLLCGFFADSQKNLFPHWRRIHRGVAMKCTMCKGKFLFAGALYSHLCLGTPEPLTFNEITDEHEGSTDTIGLRYQCSICSHRQLPGFFNYMVHLRKDHNQCELCLETLKNQKDLEHHMKKHKLNHFCWKCSVSYCAKPNFMTHLFWKHGTESVDCSKCLKKKWPHIYHFCVPPEYFACDVCGLYFTKPKALIVHRRLHTGEKLKRCPKTSCQERFISKKLLQKHLETIHVKQPAISVNNVAALPPPPITEPPVEPSSETPSTAIATSELPPSESQTDTNNIQSEAQSELNETGKRDETENLESSGSTLVEHKSSTTTTDTAEVSASSGNKAIDNDIAQDKVSDVSSVSNLTFSTTSQEKEVKSDDNASSPSRIEQLESNINKEVEKMTPQQPDNIESKTQYHEAETQKLDTQPDVKLINGLDEHAVSNDEMESTESINDSTSDAFSERPTSIGHPSSLPTTNHQDDSLDGTPEKFLPIKIKLNGIGGLHSISTSTSAPTSEKQDSSCPVEKLRVEDTEVAGSPNFSSKEIKSVDVSNASKISTNSSSGRQPSPEPPSKPFNLAEIQGPNLSEDESDSGSGSDSDTDEKPRNIIEENKSAEFQSKVNGDDKTNNAESDALGSLFSSKSTHQNDFSVDNISATMNADLDDLDNILNTNLDAINQKRNHNLVSSSLQNTMKTSEPNLNQSSMDIDDIDGLSCSKKPSDSKGHGFLGFDMGMGSNLMNLDDGDGINGSMSPLLSPLDDFNFSVPEIPTFEENHLPEHIIRENALFSIQHEHDYCQPRNQLGLKRKAPEPSLPSISSSGSGFDSGHRSVEGQYGNDSTPPKPKKLKVMKPSSSPIKKVSKKRRRSSSSSSSSSSSCSSCGSNCSCSSSSSGSSSSSSSSSSSDEGHNNVVQKTKNKKMVKTKKDRSPIKLTLPVVQKVKRKVGRPRKEKPVNNGAMKPPTEKRPRGAPRKYNKKGGKIPKVTMKLSKGNENVDPLPPGAYIMESDLETDDSGSEEIFHMKQLTELVGTGSKPSPSIPDANSEDIWTMNNEKYLLKLVRGIDDVEELRPPPLPPTPSPPPTPIKIKKEKPLEKIKYSLKNGGEVESKLKVRNVPIKPLIVKRNVHSNLGNSVTGNLDGFVAGNHSVISGGDGALGSYSFPSNTVSPATTGKPQRRRVKIGTGKGGGRRRAPANKKQAVKTPDNNMKYDPSVSYIGHNVREESDYEGSLIVDESEQSFVSSNKKGRGSRNGARNRNSKKVKVSVSKPKKVEVYVDEKLYCYCQCPHDNVSQMIGCDGKECQYKWFHFECVGIVVPPKGKWFCSGCRSALREKKKAAAAAKLREKNSGNPPPNYQVVQQEELI